MEGNLDIQNRVQACIVTSGLITSCLVYQNAIVQNYYIPMLLFLPFLLIISFAFTIKHKVLMWLSSIIVVIGFFNTLIGRINNNDDPFKAVMITLITTTIVACVNLAAAQLFISEPPTENKT